MSWHQRQIQMSMAGEIPNLTKQVAQTDKPFKRKANPTSLGLISISAIVAIGVLALDLALPLGVAAGVPYVALVLIGNWYSSARPIYVLAILGSFLTLVGYLGSDSGGVFWMVVANRALALFAIWATAILIASRKKIEIALREARDELENKVARRTKELKISEERFRDFTESTSDWLWEQDSEFRFTYVAAFKESSFSRHQQKAIGKTRWEFVDADIKGDAHWRRHIEDVQYHRKFRDFQYESYDADDTKHLLSVNGKPILDGKGNFAGYRGTVVDITEQARLESAHRFQARIIDAMKEGMALTRLSNQEIVHTSPNLNAMFGYDEGELSGRPWAVMNKGGQEEADRNWQDIVAQIHSSGGWSGEVCNIRKDGTEFWSFAYITILDHPEYGDVAVSIISDISERKNLEEQLRQSQKMEVVGHLAGGVAHDFNNLLGVMIGNAEMLKPLADGDDSAERNVDAIIRAVSRGASLTQRLLSFSRRQVLDSKPAALRDLVLDLEDMLKRTLGATIELAIHPGPEDSVVSIDAHQFENALMNLSINARDAMPDGGKLTIEISNITLDEQYTAQHENVNPGDHILVAVSDTGTGMTPEVLENVFEPFYTTKEVGVGSGLGLSMVYGFVKQSKGHISIYSEVGHGTTVKLYFPLSAGAMGKLTDTSWEKSEQAPGLARILVVEDDPNLREIPVGILTRQGYEVAQAKDGAEAIDLLKSTPFDLLFTDIILPGGVNGVDVASEAKKIQTNIKILYTTGYAENAILTGSHSNKGISVVSKPYQQIELLEKIRQALDKASP